MIASRSIAAISMFVAPFGLLAAPAQKPRAFDVAAVKPATVSVEVFVVDHMEKTPAGN